MRLNRRAFLVGALSAAAAPQSISSIAQPNLKGCMWFGSWRRRFFPGWSPPAPAHFLTPDLFQREFLLQLRTQLEYARLVNRAFEEEFARDCDFLAGDTWAPRAGETLHLRRPARFNS